MPAFSLRPETLADLRSYILSLPEREQLAWNGRSGGTAEGR